MTKLIIANWKSHKNTSEISEWLEDFGKQVALTSSDATIIIAPPFPFLSQVSQAIKNWGHNNIKLSVQDISPFPAGSYTGAVTGFNLDGLHVDYAIVGHSERRKYFHETHTEVAQKVAQAIDTGMTPIVCVDDEYTLAQANAIDQALLQKCVVAYEPIEAIGSGENQPIDEVKPVIAEIKKAFGDVPVLYGGSVDVESVDEYLAVTDGVLVGGASLDAKEFLALCR